MVDSSEAVDLLTTLVRIPSVNPQVNDEGMDETQITDFLFDKLSTWGFEVKLQEVSSPSVYKFLPKRPDAKRNNVIARFKTSSKRKLVLNGHVDTVSGVNMKDPFNPVIQNGLLRGRGSSDMKSGIASMIVAARAIMESEAEIDGTVILTLVVDEEVWGAGTSTFAGSEKVDYAIVCEPTNLKISTSQAGYIDLNVMSRGESMHGSTMAVGDRTSAVLNAVRLIGKITDLPALREVVEYDGVKMPNTINIAPIPTPINPSYAWMSHEEFGMNVLIGTAPRKTKKESESMQESILAEITRLVDDSNSKKEDNWVDVNARWHGFIQEKSKFVHDVEAAVRGVLGMYEYGHTLTMCDGSFFHDAGVPTILLGPGRMEVSHSSHEVVNIEQVRQATAIYAGSILRILS